MNAMKKRLFMLLLAAVTLPARAEELYLVGGATPIGWVSGGRSATKMTETESGSKIFVWSGLLTANTTNDDGFKVCKGDDIWDAYRATTSGQDIKSGEEYDITTSDDYKWDITETGYYTVTVDLNEMKLKAVKEFSVSCTFNRSSSRPYAITSCSIASAEALTDFAKLVNADSYSTSMTAELTADITANSAFIPIGTSSNMFVGNFNGNGHTVTLEIDNNESYQGMFGVVKGGARISDLIVAGSVKAESKVGGIIGYADGGGTITLTNVINRATIQSKGSDSANAAGLVGCAVSSTVIAATNCGNMGNVSGQDGQCAAFAGWTQSSGETKTTFTNCWNSGTISNMENNCNLYRNTGSVTADNCYDATGITTYTQGTQLTLSSTTDNALTSGELCYKLNGDQSSIIWYQTLAGTDSHPYPDSGHKQVYQYSASIYSNLPVSGGKVQISTAEQLATFASEVNAGTSMDAELTADIDYTDYTDQAAMIGRRSKTYKSTFDGKEHTVTVNFNNTTAEESGLFRRVNGATIKNLKVAGTITTNQKYAGGIVSGIWQRGTITNCESAVTIEDEASGDATHGGILALVQDKDDIKILNCVFSGTLNAPNRTGCGGIIGWPDNAVDHEVTVRNCLVTGSITLKDDDNNDVIVRNSADTYNNYYTCALSNSLRNSKSATEASSIADTGELCYLLNGSTQGGTDWYQNLSGTPDDMPTPFSSHARVYATGVTLKCDGTPATDAAVTYTNTAASAATVPEHSYSAGWCTVCRKLDEGYITPDEDGYYGIGSAGELQWFAAIVDNGEWSARAMLTEDIATYTGPYIGTSNDKSFKGIFDGKGHKISVEFGNESKIGLFRCVKNGTIQNLVVDGTINAGDGSLMAGLVNESRLNSVYRNIVVATDMTTTHSGDGTHGGVISVAWDTPTVENVAFVGSINAASDEGSCGIIGYAHSGSTITYRNCYVTGTLSLKEGNNRVFGRNGEYCENCYTTLDMTNLNDADRFTGGGDVTSSQVSSGELCYLLNGSTCYGVDWTQTIGTDSYPVPFSTHGIVNKISSAGYTTQYIPSTDVTIPDGIHAYAGETDDNLLRLNEITGSISRNDAVILSGTANEFYSFVPTTGAIEAEVNNLQGSTGSDGDVGDGSTIYALAKPDDEAVGFFLVGDGIAIPAGKAYLTCAGGSVKGFTFAFDDDVTAIDHARDAVCRQGSTIVNLAGQRVGNAQLRHGLYILDGRKVLVKSN